MILDFSATGNSKYIAETIAKSMKDVYPVWKETECEMCLGCLHRCPKFAIQYRNPNTAI